MRTRLNPDQLDLRNIFSVKQILLSRGFEVLKESAENNLLVREPDFDAEIWNTLFQIFHIRKTRIELKNYCYSMGSVNSKIVQDLLNHSSFIKESARFNNTLEWYAGELMIRKFAAFSASYVWKLKT